MTIYTHKEFLDLTEEEHAAEFVRVSLAFELVIDKGLTDAEEDEYMDPISDHWWMMSKERRERAEDTFRAELEKITAEVKA